MEQWTTACPDWETRILSGQSLIVTPVLFPEVADHAMTIFKSLKIVDMLGRPEIGEVTREWVFNLAEVFFGSLNDEENRRYIQEFMLLISKKNTKSTIAAGLMMTVLITNVRDSAEFLILAPTKESADNAFTPARDMVRADPELSDLILVQEHIRTITYRSTGAKLKVVAADGDTVSGSKAAGILIDELWAFGKRARSGSMLTEATGGLASRTEGFVIYLTTQSDEPPAGVFKEKLEYARKVRDGEIVDNRFLPVLYEYPQQMIDAKAYLDPKNYHITNPNLGASVDEAFLNRKITSAQMGTGDESIQQVLAKHLNIEIGLNLRSDRWAGTDYWLTKVDKSVTLKEVIRRSEVIVVGIDGGGLDDLLGLGVIGREKETGVWLAWMHAWAHPIALERRKSEASKYKDFKKQGDLTVVDYIGEDVDGIVEIVKQIDQAELLSGIGVDPIGIGSVLDALEDAGIPSEKIQGISQGWKLGGAIKTAERDLAKGNIVHSGSPLMSWCVSNARVEQRANSILVTKHASGTGKIDPLMGFFNAVSLMSMNPDAMTEKYMLQVL